MGGKRKKRKQIDMLQGSLMDKILLFAIPLAATSILQQLFSSVDIAILGKFANSQAQAAVGCDGPVINMILNLFIGISVGANVVIARYIGENKEEKVKDTVHTAILSAIVMGIFLLIIGVFSSKYILQWMNTPEDVIGQATTFLRIYFLGAPFIMLYNFGAAILRSIGDTKRPLYCLALTGVVNAALNMTLVIVFHLGVAGVAVGTVVANIISSSMILYFLTQEENCIRVSIRKLKISMLEFKKIIKIGLPAGLQSLVFSVSNVFIQASLNGYGADAVAGSAITLNFEYYAYFIISAFIQATVTFTSQNFGAKQYDRCKKIFKEAFIVSILVSAVMSFCFVFFRSSLISIFTSDPEVARYASIRMVHLLSLYMLINVYEISGGALRGMGYSMTPAIITIFGTCVFRLMWVATISKWYPSFEMLMDVYPVSWIITGILVLSTYFVMRNKIFSEERKLQLV